MKKMIKGIGSLALAIALAGCTVGGSTATATTGKDSSDSESYKVGILQLVQHPALDLATKGFKDVLEVILQQQIQLHPLLLVKNVISF